LFQGAIAAQSIVELRSVASDLSLSATVHHLVKQTHELRKKKDPAFIKALWRMLNDKYEHEMHGVARLEVPEQARIRHKEMEDFRHSMYVAICAHIEKDDTKTLDFLLAYMPVHKNLHALARRCAVKKLKSITSQVLAWIDKPPQGWPQVNVNYFMQKVVAHADVDFLDYLWNAHPRVLKQVFGVLKSRGDFWLFDGQEKSTPEILQQFSNANALLKSLSEASVMSLEKLQWLDSKGIGLAQYTQLPMGTMQYLLLEMDDQELVTYMANSHPVTTHGPTSSSSRGASRTAMTSSEFFNQALALEVKKNQANVLWNKKIFCMGDGRQSLNEKAQHIWEQLNRHYFHSALSERLEDYHQDIAPRRKI